MKCEFVKDYYNTIWFQYASQIYVRPNIHSQKASEDQQRRIREINMRHREKLTKELDLHEAENQGQMTQKLKDMMMRQYHIMREKAGIQDVLDNSDGSDYETEQVFKKLRPNAGHKLMDLITGKVKAPKKKLYRRKDIVDDPLHHQNLVKTRGTKSIKTQRKPAAVSNSS